MKLDPDLPPPAKRGLFARVRANFLTGLIVILPIAVTIWLVWSVIGIIDGWVLPFVPERYNPVVLIKQHFDVTVDIRGVGVVFFLMFTLIVGWLAKGLLGRSIIRWTEGVVTQMPVVRSVYGGMKQIAETVLASGSTSFDKACLVEYPRRNIWAIAFISTNAKGEIAAKGDDEMISVFLPTTPNPTSGFLLFVPKRDVKVLDMTVEDAAKLVISAGLVYPDTDPKKVREQAWIKSI
ncbi:DUF502 domain-containing protein [Dinoroseobacter shibae]|nr:DUF502 domain-containing protein [Dinoroseobacter shibae]URF48208.1 DUF502 domain-containing protein [Dinoroseobacter shibae]URF52518.1 DUF502 domain-containing protein [Dinoroseobacter shibae]